MRLKPKPYLLLLLLVPATLAAEGRLYSPTWGFRVDLPPGYVYVEGNAFDRFSFQGPSNAMFDMLVYDGVYLNIQDMVQDVNRRLGNTGNTSFFEYGGREAAIIELHFANMEGWGLALVLAPDEPGGNPPLMLALAYAPAGTENVDLLHISILNSIAPTLAETRLPGPVMEFAFPRGELVETPLAGGLGLTAMIRENDAYAAQALIEQEFLVLTLYQFSPYWQEAWIRFYRAIFRDSWDRIADAAFQLERSLNNAAPDMDPGENNRAFAQKMLTFVQGFYYERNFDGSDVINLVTGVTEGRGDCDSRAMLWAVILAHANIPAAIMVSRHYSHAMGLVDVPGIGARFEAGGTRWLVAETTSHVELGLIAAHKSSVENWLGVIFE